ncbi:MAG: hypothetical protein JRI72_06750 [Deltaproteobacteria bacterium]|nr:hypothetical protein [Deltaproteobacteria bacterium]
MGIFECENCGKELEYDEGIKVYIQDLYRSEQIIEYLFCSVGCLNSYFNSQPVVIGAIPTNRRGRSTVGSVGEQSARQTDSECRTIHERGR